MMSVFFNYRMIKKLQLMNGLFVFLKCCTYVVPI